MSIGSTFVIGGFLLTHDVFVRLALVTVGSAMAAAAALGH